MKMFNYKKVKTFLLSGLAVLSVAFGAVLYTALAPIKADAATLGAGVFQTDGASVRIFKATVGGENSDNGFEETDRQGIRFHVEMGAGYSYNGTTLLDTNDTETNVNGAYKMAEGFKTYTLILPTRLLDGNELTVSTEKVMKLDTSGYWFSDGDGNWESVAYVYNIPETRYTDNFSYRGVVCTVAEDGTETVVAQTEVAERMLTEIAKRAYLDTIDENSNYWGTSERDADAAPLIKKFVPTYSITYQYYDAEQAKVVELTEEVLWGDAPKEVPNIAAKEDEHIDYETVWYDTENHEELNVSSVMNWSTNQTFTVSSTTSTDFQLTGVADYNNFTVGETAYSGVKIYATLPISDFYTADEITNGTTKMIEFAAQAVDIVHEGNGTFGGLQGAWGILEGSGDGAQMRLILAFDSSTLQSGDKLILKSTSMFYANNVMYGLTEDYTIDYTLTNGVEDYGVFLGYLHNSDVKRIENWDEYGDGTRVRIRVTFYDDVFINSDFKFVYNGELPAGYTYPVYTKCNDTGTETEIVKGYYYWNNGEHTILELEGYAYHSNDELFGAPGTMIVQNGGYYIFEDAMYAYYNGKEWVVGAEKGTFGADAFEWKGSNYTTGTQEVRFTTNTNTTLKAGGTTDRWFDEVRALNVENMSDEPYAVYATKPDGTVTEIKEFMYHGQSTDSGYNHIFAFKGYIGTEAGETVTVVAGTRFWYGSEYYTATEQIIFYFNGENWIVNHDGAVNYEVGVADFTGQAFNFFESNTNKVRMAFVNEQFGGATGALVLESGSIKVNNTSYTSLAYHGNGNKLFEIKGDSTAPIGVNAFSDRLVIEAGTRVWLNNLCMQFTETIEWRFIGEGALKDGSGNPMAYHWAIDKNTDITVADITSMYNATDAGGEVRFTISAGILTNTFYGFAAMDTSKGIPVVNGVEKPHYAFSYGVNNNLLAVRGGEYGTELGDYILIPEGSVWWTTQGSLTFTEEIYAVWNGAWNFGFNTNSDLGAIGTDNIKGIYNYKEDALEEIRIEIPLGITDTYYGPIAITEGVSVTKADGTVIKSVFGYWYGGASGSYTAEHSLIGLRGTAIAGASNGDLLTISKGAKIVFRTSDAIKGYRSFDADVVYTYVDGAWLSGNQNATVTYTVEHATVEGAEKLINGRTCEFTVVPDDGYAVASVTVNGNALPLNANNQYSFTAVTTNEVVIEIVEGYNVTFSIGTGTKVDNGAIVNGDIKAVASGSSLTFTVAAESGYRLVSVDGDGVTNNNDGTYTVTPTANTTVTITAVKQWTVTAATSGGVAVDKTSITVDEGSNATFTLTVPNGATIKANGTEINGTSYTVSNVTADTTITFTTWYTVTVNAGNSSVSGVTSGELYESGSTVEFTVTPNTGYNVTSVTVNGTAVSSYSATVSGATTIAVNTALKTYTVTLNASNASVSGISNNQTITHGQTYSFTVSANSGYQLTSVTINGTEQGTGGSYSFTASGATSIVVTVDLTPESKKAKIVEAITNNPSTYLTGMTISADGTKITSTSTTATVSFTDAFFELLKQYGYTSVTFTIGTSNSNAKVRTGESAGNWYDTTDLTGETQNLSSAQSYTAATTGFLSASKANVDWTLSDVSFS